MGRAVLTYIDDYNNNITLESGSLFYVDQCTKSYKSEEQLKENYSSRTKGSNGKIKLYYISSNSNKEELPILIDENEPIYIKNDHLKNQISELEKGRKLLYSSKNKMFLRLAIRYKMIKQTLRFQLKISKKEYDYALKKGLNVISNQNGYFINSIDLFSYVISNKASVLKEAFENALETWKNSINQLTLEEIYYFCRNIRVLIKEYNKKIKQKVGISNFEPINKNLKLIRDNRIILIENSRLLKVRKKVKE